MGAFCSCLTTHDDAEQFSHESPNHQHQPHNDHTPVLSFFNKCTRLISPMRVWIFCDKVAPQQSTHSNEIAQGTVDADSDSSEECPTCLEGYTDENPKITAECSHHFHLPCIFEWQNKSQECPCCRKVLIIKELLD